MIDEPIDPQKLAVFVQEYLKAESQPDAAIIAITRAGLRNAMWHPSHIADVVLAKPEVQTAIAIARKAYRPRDAKDISADSITNDLEDLYQRALSDRQYPAAVSAKKLQSEIAGLIRTKVDFTFAHKVEELTTAELLKIASKGKVVEGEFTEVPALEHAPSGNNV